MKRTALVLTASTVVLSLSSLGAVACSNFGSSDCSTNSKTYGYYDQDYVYGPPAYGYGPVYGPTYGYGPVYGYGPGVGIYVEPGRYGRRR